MKRKDKMALLDNYVNIFRILHKCKTNLIFAKSQEEILLLESFCHKLLYLKEEHEKYLNEIGMYDDAFLLLKKQLENSLDNNKSTSTIPQSHSFLKNITTTEERLNELKFKITKKKKSV